VASKEILWILGMWNVIRSDIFFCFVLYLPHSYLLEEVQDIDQEVIEVLVEVVVAEVVHQDLEELVLDNKKAKKFF
jgi:hypothetical protein